MPDLIGLQPSTDWSERIAADEAARYAGFAQQFAAIQKRKSERYGTGRALHRKQLLAATGRLEVLGDLPTFAAQGLFARPGNYEVQLRLSNGGTDRASDSTPDIRGFSLRVLGVEGDSALGNGPARSQDFALINHEVFAFSSSTEFVDFVVAAAGGGGALLLHMFKHYGLLGGLSQIIKTIRIFSRSFKGFATETFFSAAPIACGPYAVRVRLLPEATNGSPQPGAQKDWAADMKAHLNAKELHYSLQLQPFVQEALTPIEDPSVNWPTPYTTVARLSLPQQDFESTASKALAEAVEKGVFDPWQALAAHRPLGDVMRARKVVYFESQKGRGVGVNTS